MLKKKAAICLYGQPRLYNKGYNYISKFIEENSKEYDIDIFIHTWWDTSVVGSYYKCSPWRNIQESDLIIDKDTINNLQKIYKPKVLLSEIPKTFNNDIAKLENTELFKNTPQNLQNNINNYISNLYSKYKVCMLFQDYCKNNNTEYDIIISSRFDILLDMNIKLDELISNKIYAYKVNRFHLADHFIVFTNSDLFINYSNTYNNIGKINSSDECKLLSHNLNIDFKFNIEELITLNLGLYYSFETIINMVIFSDKINNFI